MLSAALLAGVERGLNRVLRLDAAATARLDRLAGRLIEVDCTTPAWRLFILPETDGLRLALHWEGEPDVRLRAPASSLARLALSRDKTAVLHGPEVSIEGDTQLLMDFTGILQDLDLDWEHELAGWAGPLTAGVLGNLVRGQARWARQSAASLQQNLAEYLSEEARTLVGEAEANARFAELDDLKLTLDRLEARIERLAQYLTARPEK